MGIFNQQCNYNQSFTKEKRGITGPQGPPAPPPAPLVQLVLLDLLAPVVLMVYQALVLISHQMEIMI